MAYVNDHSEVLALLSEWAIEASVEELRMHDRLTIVLRDALRHGADINDLSAITGLTPIEIRRRTNGNLAVLDDIEYVGGGLPILATARSG